MKKLCAAAGAVALAVVTLAGPSSASTTACTPYANNPYKLGGTVYGTGGQTGTCSTKVDVNLKRQRPGPDQLLVHGSRNGPGSVPLRQACDWSGSWGIYVESYTPNGSIVYSDVEQISC